jgi:CBS domain containing-hemolysin-like protein
VVISLSYSTLLILILGEIIPKSFAKQNAERLALIYARFFYILVLLLTPFTIIFSK